jgi:amidophosphoribosyltransferase
MTDLIQCDELVFQTLDDLTAACIDAADGKSEVKEFEVGVFCGKYKTPVSPDYFERSSQLYGSKKRKCAAVAGEDENSSAVRVGGIAPVIVSPVQEAWADDRNKGSEHQQDIKYTLNTNA